jgi:hypothetical protein
LILFVKKKNGFLWMCVDYCGLSQSTHHKKINTLYF